MAAVTAAPVGARMPPPLPAAGVAAVPAGARVQVGGRGAAREPARNPGGEWVPAAPPADPAAAPRFADPAAPGGLNGRTGSGRLPRGPAPALPPPGTARPAYWQGYGYVPGKAGSVQGAPGGRYAPGKSWDPDADPRGMSPPRRGRESGDRGSASLRGDAPVAAQPPPQPGSPGHSGSPQRPCLSPGSRQAVDAWAQRGHRAHRAAQQWRAATSVPRTGRAALSDSPQQPPEQLREHPLSSASPPQQQQQQQQGGGGPPAKQAATEVAGAPGKPPNANAEAPPTPLQPLQPVRAGPPPASEAAQQETVPSVNKPRSETARRSSVQTGADGKQVGFSEVAPLNKTSSDMQGDSDNESEGSDNGQGPRGSTTDGDGKKEDGEEDGKEAEPKNCKSKTKKIIFSPPMQCMLLVLVLTDLILLALSLYYEEGIGDKEVSRRLHIATTIDANIFLVEVSLRAWCTGFGDFFWGRHRVLNILEFFVVVACVIIEFVTLLDDAEGFTRSFGPIVLGLFRALKFLRVCRFCVVCAELVTGSKHVARSKVSKGRKRLEIDGYDLDLAYVTPRVMAMSWPGSRLEQFYRNSMNTVASYLDKFHTDHYKVYNLCKERGYNTELFHDRVERVLMDDHNAGDIPQLHAFCESAEQWHGQSPENVIIVHCKAGKGRTGTCICSYLMWTGLESTAASAMQTFANARTEGGFSGVESPSQARYLGYFEKYVNSLNRKLPKDVAWKTRSLEVGPLPVFALYPSQLWLMVLGDSKGTVLWRSDPSRPFDETDAAMPAFAAQQAKQEKTKKKKIIVGPGNTPPGPDARYDIEVHPPTGAGGGPYKVSAQDYYTKHELTHSPPAGSLYITYHIDTMPELCADVRLHWFHGDQVAPVPIGNSVWWAWFHPVFEDRASGIKLTREKIDGPHKSKASSRFPENFMITMRFQQ